MDPLPPLAVDQPWSAAAANISQVRESRARAINAERGFMDISCPSQSDTQALLFPPLGYDINLLQSENNALQNQKRPSGDKVSIIKLPLGCPSKGYSILHKTTLLLAKAYSRGKWQLLPARAPPYLWPHPFLSFVSYWERKTVNRNWAAILAWVWILWRLPLKATRGNKTLIWGGGGEKTTSRRWPTEALEQEVTENKISGDRGKCVWLDHQGVQGRGLKWETRKRKKVGLCTFKAENLDWNFITVAHLRTMRRESSSSHTHNTGSVGFCPETGKMKPWCSGHTFRE